MEKQITCAVILARSGSKEIRNKNIIKIKGKPLLYYTAKQASLLKEIDKVFILTDSKKYLSIIKNFKIKKVIGITRSKKSATDNAQSEIALLDFVKKYNYENVIFIQATNIFLTDKDIKGALKKFFKDKFDSMLSVIESKKFLWKFENNSMKAVNYDYTKRKLRQQINNYYLENGSFYIFRRKGFIKYKNRIYGKIGFYIMNQKSYFDIDDREQLTIVKKIF